MARTRRTRREDKPKVQHVEAKTENQKLYIRSIIENDIVFCSGPSGSGKSFVAAGIAAEHLHRGDIEQIIITRPLVCTGKDIGSLPGELGEKIAPYLLPMQENLKFFFGRSYYGHYDNEGQILYKPLEILDEAQNCTTEQIKMFITRMGKNSKVFINGDINQDDLRGRSGLDYCISKLEGIDGVGICRLGYEDIQRNDIIGRVLTALEN